MKHFISTLLLVAFALGSIHAQQATKSKYNFIVIPNFQVLNGSEATSNSIHLNAGFANANNHFTINAGIDNYRFRTVPLMLDYKHFFGNKQNKVFAYTSLGYAIPWLLEEQKRMYWTNWGGINNLADYSSGLQYQFGIGYAILNKKQKGFLLNIGFNSKSLKEEIQQMVFNGSTSVLMPYKTIYHLNRLSIGIGYTL